MHKYLRYSTVGSMLGVWLLLIGLPLVVFGELSAEGSSSKEGQSLLAKGNAAYGKGQFEEALKAYQQLVSQGHQSAAVYYNLGNAHYRLDEIPDAILNYEKAYKLAPGDEDIQVNLRFANQKITDKIEAVPEFFVLKWWKGLVMAFSLQSWTILAAVLFFIGFVLLAIYLFVRMPVLKRGAFYSGLLFVLLALFSLLLANRQYSYLNNTQQAIVFRGTVNVKSAPGAQQKTLFVIHEGTKVKIGQKEADWIEIVLPNGNVGWIESAAVKEI